MRSGTVPSAAVPAGAAFARPTTRRAVLAASAAAVPMLLAGCKGVQALGSPPPAAPDITELRAAISAEKLMVDRYRVALTVAAGDPAARAAFGSVLTQHRQHLAQLKSRLIEPAISTSPAPGAHSGPVTLPTGLAAAIGVLEGSEQAASDRLLAGLPVVPPALAQLFASIAASEATHVPLLRSLRGTR